MPTEPTKLKLSAFGVKYNKQGLRLRLTRSNKMTIIAKFSNGFKDEYKGQRDVRAAWMITRKSDGKVLASGHSLDRAKAAKTAAGKLMHAEGLCFNKLPMFDVPKHIYAGADYSYLFKMARKYGYDGRAVFHEYKRWAKAKNAERRAAAEASTQIEIVDL